MEYKNDDFCQDVKQCLSDSQYKRFEGMVRDNLSTVNNYKFIHEVLMRCNSYERSHAIEILLNCGVNASNFDIQRFIEEDYKRFGDDTGGRNVINGSHYNGLRYNLALSIIRIMLQNLSKQEAEVHSHRDRKTHRNPLHSVMVSIKLSFNSANGTFYWEHDHTKRENAKKSYLLLFTLIVLTCPSLLGKKNYDPFFDPPFSEPGYNLTPLELLAFYKTSHEMDHPFIQEFYDSFQEIIELTQSGEHSLTSTIKRLIGHINYAHEKKQKLFDCPELGEILVKIKQEVGSQGNTLAEKCVADLGKLIIDNLPTIRLDTCHSTYYRDLLKRKILDRLYEVNIGNINTIFEVNFYCFREIIQKFDTKTLDNFIKAVLGDVCVEKLNLDNCGTLSQGSDVIKNSERVVLDFLSLKEFLESNTAPHETRYEEKCKNKKVSEEALSDIYYLYEEAEKGYKDKDSEQANDAQGKSKQLIFSSIFAITGIATGIAVAVYLEMLAVGIAVGACCLVAAAIIYCCSGPSNSLEKSSAEAATNKCCLEAPN